MEVSHRRCGKEADAHCGVGCVSRRSVRESGWLRVNADTGGDTVSTPTLSPLPESADDAIKVFFVATIRDEHAAQSSEALALAIRAALAAERETAVQEERARCICIVEQHYFGDIPFEYEAVAIDRIVRRIKDGSDA